MSKRILIFLVSIIWLIWGITGIIIKFGLERCPYYSAGENALCLVVEIISNTPLIHIWLMPFGIIIGLAFIFGLALLIGGDIKENKNFNVLVSVLLILFLGGFGGLIYLGYTQLKSKNNKKIVDQYI